MLTDDGITEIVIQIVKEEYSKAMSKDNDAKECHLEGNKSVDA